MAAHGGNAFIPGLGSAFTNINDRGKLRYYNNEVKSRLGPTV